MSSTLASESQVLSDGLGLLEWIKSLLCEVLFPDFTPKDRKQWLMKIPSLAVTDCKSVYDHVTGDGSAGTVSEKRTAIDLVIIRESLVDSGTTLRWASTSLQLADGLTKDSSEPMDRLRGALKVGLYQLHEEDEVLRQTRYERQRRLDNGVKRQKENLTSRKK